MPSSKRVLTGLQPSGLPHLGNYFGAIRPAIELGRDRELFLFLADFHILNIGNTRELNREYSQDLAATLLACGLDPQKNLLYAQSAVPEVCELMWILSCQAPFGLLLRAHSFKDKQAKGIEVNCGLFNYPILMAADILLYDADLVPVGKDQKQHLEMARDIAQKFNTHYGEVLKLPEPLISDDVGVVPGLDGEKMSKSKNNVISIFASDAQWKKQVMAIVTDSKGLEDPKDPDSCHVYNIYKLLASKTEAQDMAEALKRGGYGYGHAKKALLEKIKEIFTPMRDKYDDWLKRPDDLRDVILAGSKKAKGLAQAKLDQVQQALGLVGRGRGSPLKDFVGSFETRQKTDSVSEIQSHYKKNP